LKRNTYSQLYLADEFVNRTMASMEEEGESEGEAE
jgi:hypothetical protein